MTKKKTNLVPSLNIALNTTIFDRYRHYRYASYINSKSHRKCILKSYLNRRQTTRPHHIQVILDDLILL